MMTRKKILEFLFLCALAVGALLAVGVIPLSAVLRGGGGETPATTGTEDSAPQPVSVIKAARAKFSQSILVTGSLAARDLVLVIPQLSPDLAGARIVSVEAEEGDFVTKGQVLARLGKAQLTALLAQSNAGLAKAKASIAQAKSKISQMEAGLEEAENAYERSKKLKRQGHTSNASHDARRAKARTAEAALASARDGLVLARASRAQVAAQRKELDWKVSNTVLRAPERGLISRRHADVGAAASAAGEALFQIIAKGEIEMVADVPEADLPKLKIGQGVTITVPGLPSVTGTLRLISPEINPTTRLGQIKIFIGVNPDLRVGSSARAQVAIAKSEGVAVPLSALTYTTGAAQVQVVASGRIITRKIVSGLTSRGLIEIKSGVAVGDMVVVRAGTFLREGDAVKPIISNKINVSEAVR